MAVPTGIDLSPTIDCYCLAARRRAREISRLFDRRLRPHGLRSTQFSVLAALALAGPRSVSDLADLLGLERTSLTRAAGLIEVRGWIATRPSEDARVRCLVLTDAGRAKVEEAYPSWAEVQDSLHAAFRADADPAGPYAIKTPPGAAGRSRP